jgi:hypothetical protein
MAGYGSGYGSFYQAKIERENLKYGVHTFIYAKAKTS